MENLLAHPSVFENKKSSGWHPVFGLSTLTQNRPSPCCFTNRFLPD
jgi:hypothetical protein